MKKTTNYSQFSFLKDNRTVNTLHVKHLIKSIAENNMLEANPIIVNHNFEVIDGQHRLEAAKVLNVPIYFVEVAGTGIDEVLSLNTNQRNWTTLDYVNAYINKGIVDYQILVDFMREHRITVSIASVVLSGAGKSAGELIKSGKFTVKSIRVANEVVELSKKISQYVEPRVMNDRNLYYCLVKLIEGNKILTDRMIKKFSMYPTKLNVMPSSQMYFRSLEEIYNFASKNRVRLF